MTAGYLIQGLDMQVCRVVAILLDFIGICVHTTCQHVPAPKLPPGQCLHLFAVSASVCTPSASTCLPLRCSLGSACICIQTRGWGGVQMAVLGSTGEPPSKILLFIVRQGWGWGGGVTGMWRPLTLIISSPVSMILCYYLYRLSTYIWSSRTKICMMTTLVWHGLSCAFARGLFCKWGSQERSRLLRRNQRFAWGFYIKCCLTFTEWWSWSLVYERHVLVHVTNSEKACMQQDLILIRSACHIHMFIKSLWSSVKMLIVYIAYTHGS